VQAPPKSRYSVQEPRPAPKATPKGEDGESEDEDDEMAEADEELSEASQELDYDEDSDSDDKEDKEGGSSSEDALDGVAKDGSKVKTDAEAIPQKAEVPKRERKRKRKEENVDLEDKYLSKLSKDDAEPQEKRPKTDDAATSDDEDAALPQHESLSKDTKSSELEKADRTVFLANVSSEAVGSKAAKKTLTAHLASVLDKDAGEKVESIRFRSVAFSAGSMPKRAAYITKQLMEATTKSTNAYAVFSGVAAAKKAVKTLNGSEVLGRHIRVDSVSHPSQTDHRRCVFVGNLGFMDDESVLQENEEGETIKKKRNKVPADVEEGLWRTFGQQGKVENVRVVRDPKTRVGKGFAYVQFYVSSALLRATPYRS
jgi:nucleolar protein 12